jgi:hypothetical protein
MDPFMPIVDRVRKLVDPAVVEFFSVKCFFMFLKSVSLAMLNNHNFYFVSIVFLKREAIGCPQTISVTHS